MNKAGIDIGTTFSSITALPDGNPFPDGRVKASAAGYLHGDIFILQAN